VTGTNIENMSSAAAPAPPFLGNPNPNHDHESGRTSNQMFGEDGSNANRNYNENPAIKTSESAGNPPQIKRREEVSFSANTEDAPGPSKRFKK
jgi:hypothetical protein